MRTVLVLAALTVTSLTGWQAANSGAQVSAEYVGSAACSRCHTSIAERWGRTRMANVVRDPREHPDAIVADFNQPHPARTFGRDQNRLRLRQQVEAALFQARWATTTFRSRRSGT